MSIRKLLVDVLPSVCVGVMLMAMLATGQTKKNEMADTTKAATHAKHLKPQATCPVTGDPIDKKLFVDYKGKRIYVCCADCIDKVKKNPEKYIKKLGKMGESVETITEETKKTGSDVKEGASMKGMDMKGMKMSGDTASKTSETGYWTCPMHPEIHQAGPGQCPICGMNLEFKKTTKASEK
jgi:YHS domain-containing protein